MRAVKSMNRWFLALALSASLGAGALVAPTRPASAEEHASGSTYISCTMDFEMEAWALFISKGSGEGRIHCDNGQQADAVIKSEAVGLGAGKMDVEHGKAVFEDLSDIDEAFGRYASSSGAAAAGETAASGGLLKIGSKVKLGFYGTGEGGHGIARQWGVVTIERKN